MFNSSLKYLFIYLLFIYLFIYLFIRNIISLCDITCIIHNSHKTSLVGIYFSILLRNHFHSSLSRPMYIILVTNNSSFLVMTFMLSLAPTPHFTRSVNLIPVSLFLTFLFLCLRHRFPELIHHSRNFLTFIPCSKPTSFKTLLFSAFELVQ